MLRHCSVPLPPMAEFCWFPLDDMTSPCGRAPAANASQLGISTPTSRKREADSSTVARVCDARRVMTSLMLCATWWCRALTISKQSTQLPQWAASLILHDPPNSQHAKGFLSDLGIAPRQVHTFWSWFVAYSSVNSGRTVLNKKFARVAPQKLKRSQHRDVLHCWDPLQQF